MEEEARLNPPGATMTQNFSALFLFFVTFALKIAAWMRKMSQRKAEYSSAVVCCTLSLTTECHQMLHTLPLVSLKSCRATCFQMNTINWRRKTFQCACESVCIEWHRRSPQQPYKALLLVQRAGAQCTTAALERLNRSRKRSMMRLDSMLPKAAA